MDAVGAKCRFISDAIGHVFQSYALFPHMTVAQNLAYGIRGRHDKGERVEAMPGSAAPGGAGRPLPAATFGRASSSVVALAGPDDRTAVVGCSTNLSPPWTAPSASRCRQMWLDCSAELGLSVVYITTI